MSRTWSRNSRVPSQLQQVADEARLGHTLKITGSFQTRCKWKRWRYAKFVTKWSVQTLTTCVQSARCIMEQSTTIERDVPWCVVDFTKCVFGEPRKTRYNDHDTAKSIQIPQDVVFKCVKFQKTWSDICFQSCSLKMVPSPDSPSDFEREQHAEMVTEAP